MNMNKIRFYLFLLMLVVFSVFLGLDTFADERKCNYYATQGEDACNSAIYQGKKCEWDGTKKGGSRCFQSDKLADEVKENITTCDQIKDSETCRSSKIDGHECIWRQNACFDNTMIDDGTGENIIADDEEDRIEQENSDSMELVSCPEGYVLENNQCIIKKVVGENICSEESVQRVLKLVGYILIIAKVLIPLILIVMGSLDLFHAVVGKDDKTLTKSIKTLMIRVVLGVFVFFIPNLVNWAFDVFYETAGGEDNKQCVTCVLDPGNCN